MKTMSNDDVIKYVATLMNDAYPGNAHVRWPKELMQTVLTEALGVIALFRPDLAVSSVDVTLQPGAVQQAPEGCGKISSVLGVVDPDTGAVMEMAEEADFELSKWFPATCSDEGTYKLASFSMDGNDNGIFIVHPPVQPGDNVVMRVQCVGGCGESALDCQYLTPVVEFMMYRLFSSEDDSATSAANARSHLSTFSNALALNLRMVQTYLEGPTNAPATQSDEA